MATTRKMLRLTFELHVPPGTGRNVYGKHVEEAAETITARVLGMAPEVFPWANELRAHTEWSYLYQDRPEMHALPANRLNTPKEDAAPSQEDETS